MTTPTAPSQTTRPRRPRAGRTQMAPTTTVIVERPLDYAQLDERYALARYLLPSELLYSSNRQVFGRAHNALRDQLDCPYKSFRHDVLDGQQRWAVYALLPRGQIPPTITLPWFHHAALAMRVIPFADAPLHIVLKLLQIELCRGAGSTRFVGRDDCYVYARSSRADFHYCVRLELEGAPDARDSDPTLEVRVIPHAHRFGRAPDYVAPSDAVYGKRPVGDHFVFLQLHSAAIAEEQVTYVEHTSARSHATLKFHDPSTLASGRGKIVADFIREYLAHLQRCGIRASTRQRRMTEAPLPPTQHLDTARLRVVGVYDNRIARERRPLSGYIEWLRVARPDLTFVALEEISLAPQGGALTLLDASREDFAEDGLLAGRLDPYRAVYGAAPHIAKQSLNVNLNDPQALAGGDYLDYQTLPLDDTAMRQRLDVSLGELYLKCAILRGLEAFPLPWTLPDHAFVRRSISRGERYTTALWREAEQLRFADLGDPTQRAAFATMLLDWGVDWHAQSEALRASRVGADEPPAYDLILGREFVVAIEDLHERILYDYDEIARRRNERHTPHPVAFFKLAAHYEAIKRRGMLSEDALARLDVFGAATPDATYATGLSAEPARASLRFYRQLVRFDHLLDEIALTHPQVTFADLTSGDWLERIERIFQADAGGARETSRRRIVRLYQKLGWFRSEKARDVMLYQGIWQDETGAFVVGSPSGMNIHGQHNAHLVRRFRVLKGPPRFDATPYVSAMGVQFVRPGQYTVTPYYFHLIDLYVENILRYSGGSK